MLFTLYTRIRPDAGRLNDKQLAEFNDYLQQPILRIHLAGWLTDAQGQKTGSMVIFDAPDEQSARSFAENSPIRKAGMVSDVHVDAFSPEVGTV